MFCLKLSDFSQKLIGKCNKEQTVFFFFPVISEWNRNLLSLSSGASTSTLDNIINLTFSNKLRKNTPSASLIDNLLLFRNSSKFENDLNKLESMVFRKYQARVESINICNSTYLELFKAILDEISLNDFIDIKYLQMIYTYLINKRYDITLFLISCMLILSPTISNHDNEKFENYKNIIKFLEEFKEYKKYLKTDDFILEKYIPNRKSADTLICTNTQNATTRSFYNSILDDDSCKELHILSINAQNWIIDYGLFNKLQARLKQGLIVKILVMDKTTPFYEIYNHNEYVFNTDFSKLKEYPNFKVKCTTIPLTNRIIEDVTHQVMRVDFLVVPNMCSNTLSIFLERTNPNASIYYDKYTTQFSEIWNNPKYSHEL